MKLGPLLGAVAGAVYLLVRRRQLGRVTVVVLGLAAAATAAYGLGLYELPRLVDVVADLGERLGRWTYAVVGLLAFLETGAFIGFVAPGESAVLVGGVIAGQGRVDVGVMFGVVWACATAGDTVSYLLGRRLGRGFLLRHGPRFGVTEPRLERVEAFFVRRGGATILVGRFIGFVRPLAPFLAGASGLPFRRFLPYDVVGAGLWSATFVGLGYVFWRSLDRVEQLAGQGILAFGLLVALVAAVFYTTRLVRDPAQRERARTWLAAQAQRPALRPLRPLLEPLWRRVLVPAGRVGAGPARFAGNRLTPGDLGLELTTLLALAAVGAFAFAGLSTVVGVDRPQLPLDAGAADLAQSLRSGALLDVARVVTYLGSLAAAALVTVAAGTWAVAQRRPLDAICLAAALGLTYAGVHLAKAATDRPRPLGALVDTTLSSFPSGHAAYAVMLVAAAVVVVRAGSGPAARLSAITVALALCAAVGVTRVYLRAHYLSDVIAGLGLGFAVCALCGLAGLVVAHMRQNPRLR